MNLFKKNIAVAENDTALVETIKKTYVVDVNKFKDKIMWRLCYSIKMPVIKVDGKYVQNNKFGDQKEIDFQNPWAYEMLCAYDSLSKIMGKELAKTIIVYENKIHNKDSSVILFPTNEIAVYGENALKNLNSVSRRDLRYQMAKRQKYIDMLNQNQK